MRLDRTVDDRKVFAVMHCVQHSNLKRRAPRNRGLPRFKIDLHTKRLGKRLKTRSQTIKRIAISGKVNSAT